MGDTSNSGKQRLRRFQGLNGEVLGAHSWCFNPQKHAQAEVSVRDRLGVLGREMNLVTGPGFVSHADRDRRGTQVIVRMPQSSVLCHALRKDEALSSMTRTEVGAIVHSSRVIIQHLF